MKEVLFDAADSNSETWISPVSCIVRLHSGSGFSAVQGFHFSQKQARDWDEPAFTGDEHFVLPNSGFSTSAPILYDLGTVYRFRSKGRSVLIPW